MANFGNLYDYNTSRGIVIPQTSTVKGAVEQAFKEIFGADFSTVPETTNGRLIEALTLLFVDVCGVNAQNANGFSLTSALGSFLDGLGATWGVERLQGETDAEYRKRIILSASRGSGFAQSVANEIGKVSGVQGVVVLDNGLEDPDVLPKDAQGNTTGHSIAVPAHTIYVCVRGGSNDGIAEAIMRTKSMGCSMDSDATLGTVVSSTVTSEGISFTATFHRPSQLYVWIDVTANTIAYTGSDAADDIEDAVHALLSDNVMNATVTKPQIVAAIAALGSGIVATEVSVSVNSSDDESTAVPVDSLVVMPYMFVDSATVPVRTTVQ